MAFSYETMRQSSLFIDLIVKNCFDEGKEANDTFKEVMSFNRCEIGFCTPVETAIRTAITRQYGGLILHENHSAAIC